MSERTPLGGMHARDFNTFREQVTLAELRPDGHGDVRFGCLHLTCTHKSKIALAALHERFRPTEGLVNILNTLKPKDCPLAKADPWGNHRCGFCYRTAPG